MSNILVIDDELAVRLSVRMILERSGHRILEAPEGRIGLSQITAENSVDLVITDIIMPNQEGIETIRTLRKRYPDLKIIAMSGGGRSFNNSYLDMSTKLGANAAIAKPFTSSELTTFVEHMLAPLSTDSFILMNLGYPK